MQSDLEGRRDLAGGGSGHYRLLSLNRGVNSCKISAVNLLRLNEPRVALPAGYDGCTGNLNVYRDGDFVYIIWKTSTTAAE